MLRMSSSTIEHLATGERLVGLVEIEQHPPLLRPASRPIDGANRRRARSSTRSSDRTCEKVPTCASRRHGAALNSSSV